MDIKFKLLVLNKWAPLRPLEFLKNLILQLYAYRVIVRAANTTIQASPSTSFNFPKFLSTHLVVLKIPFISLSFFNRRGWWWLSGFFLLIFWICDKSVFSLLPVVPPPSMTWYIFSSCPCTQGSGSTVDLEAHHLKVLQLAL